ncbi:MAG: cytochrome c3 family protein [Spirochaetota bacterium]
MAKIYGCCRAINVLIFIFIIYCVGGCNKIENNHTIKITGVNEFLSGNNIQRTFASTNPVYFSHTTHEKNNVKCVTCHHKKHNDERIKTCAACHKGLPGAQTIHRLCFNCHGNNKKYYKNCDGCHAVSDIKMYNDILDIFQNTGKFTQNTHKIHKEKINCDVCHHPVSGEKQITCNYCHAGISGMKIFHGFCKDCHKRRNINNDCSFCHNYDSKKISYKDIITIEKTGHRLPPIRFNHKRHIEEYETECIDCHHNGSLKRCSECHGKKDKGEVISLRGAFHQQCHECHVKSKGPKGCAGCHAISSAQ